MNTWKIFVLIGFIFIFVGSLLYFKVPIGRLPGDVFIDKGNYKIYIPIGTSIVISILAFIVWFISMFWKK